MQTYRHTSMHSLNATQKRKHSQAPRHTHQHSQASYTQVTPKQCHTDKHQRPRGHMCSNTHGGGDAHVATIQTDHQETTNTRAPHTHTHSHTDQSAQAHSDPKANWVRGYGGVRWAPQSPHCPCHHLSSCLIVPLPTRHLCASRACVARVKWAGSRAYFCCWLSEDRAPASFRPSGRQGLSH